VQTFVTCGWCHESNRAGETFCRTCGHEVGAARMNCRCPQCEADYQRWLAEASRINEMEKWGPRGRPGLRILSGVPAHDCEDGWKRWRVRLVDLNRSKR
jgi:hypothetical protein